MDAPDVLVVGGGLGGIAAAIAACRHGATVLLVEPTDWLGGQLTTQLAPPDEHRRIEHLGRTRCYAELRSRIRRLYRDRLPLTSYAASAAFLNPGAGWVSPLCHEPWAALAAIDEMLAPFRSDGRLTVLHQHRPTQVEVDGDRVVAVEFVGPEHDRSWVTAAVVVDATETGVLLALSGTEHVCGAEGADDHDEPSAPTRADPTDIQSITWALAVEHLPGQDHTIDKPTDYDWWRTFRPQAWGGRSVLDWRGPSDVGGQPATYFMDPDPPGWPQNIPTDHRFLPSSPNLWTYRRIRARRQFVPGTFASDITVINWPQNDYVAASPHPDPDGLARRGAAAQSRALLYWLQTEAPRPDGGTGYPGLRPATVCGTDDGLAKAPYVREGLRIRAITTVAEQDVSTELRTDPLRYDESVGIGHYYWIDLHPSCSGSAGRGGRPHPFEIPLGALVPVRMENLIPGAKNIGTTHLTNGCYRVHPVEWAIGEAAGTLAAHCVRAQAPTQQIARKPSGVEDLQRDLMHSGVPLHWPAGTRW